MPNEKVTSTGAPDARDTPHAAYKRFLASGLKWDIASDRPLHVPRFEPVLNYANLGLVVPPLPPFEFRVEHGLFDGRPASRIVCDGEVVDGPFFRDDKP